MIDIKIQAGRHWKKAKMATQEVNGENRVFLKFPYDTSLLKFARSLGEAKWNPDYKMWTANTGLRTQFRLDFGVQGQDNPYLRWRIEEEDWPRFEMDRPYMDHQVKAIRQALSCRRMLWAQEMRTGKTLQAIKVLEETHPKKAWWIAPRSALAGVMIDFERWETELDVEFFTYEQIVKRVDNWKTGEKAPDALIIDEVHKVKTPGTQRTHAVEQLAHGMIEDHPDPIIIAMSGTVAPKDPSDWWQPIEIIAPGYLQEGNKNAFKRRLSLTVDGESVTGGWFPKFLTWFDDPKKCKICGALKAASIHKSDNTRDTEHDRPHKFVPSIDELTQLRKRLNGVVHVQYKKDCLDLPEMERCYWYYNGGWKMTHDIGMLDIVPDDRMKELVSAVKKQSVSAASAMTRLKELSDGFQYTYEYSDKMITCKACHGEGMRYEWEQDHDEEEGQEEYRECSICDGEGEVPEEIRVGSRVDTPKDALLRQHLEEFEPTGRNVVFTAFQESTDRVVDLCRDAGWNVMRVDGRGWHYFGQYTFSSDKEALKAFADKKNFDKIVFVGHPKSGGAGFSLSASSCLIFYSNVEEADDKLQGEARIHDLNMDTQMGAVVHEYFHLQSDVECISRYLKKVGLYEYVLGDSQG